jgi:DNA polymerase-3 subunit alpha
LSSHRSETGLPLALRYTHAGIGCEILFGEEWRVSPSDGLQGSLVEKLGRQSVTVEY